MYIDSRLQVSTAQALTATAVSTDTIDLGSADRIIGPGEDLWWIIAVKTGLAGTTPTFLAAVETDTTSSFGTVRTVGQSAQFSSLPTGAFVIIPMPFDNDRHLRLKYTLGGTSPTITVDAFLTDQEPTFLRSYTPAITG